jgi:hypothetical protein
LTWCEPTNRGRPRCSSSQEFMKSLTRDQEIKRKRVLLNS